MRKLFSIILLLLVNMATRAQAPQAIPYQAVARNSSGSILISTNISVRFTIRDSTATGSVKYRETHSVTTTAQGMFSVNVGQGSPVTGTFSGINWGTNAKFMQVEMDPAGGSSYIDMGTQQMMSVPYALNSASLKLNVSATGDTLYSGGGNYVLIPGISAANFSYSVGASYGGGKIAYILQPGDPGYVAGQLKGLIAAPSDQSTGIIWGCFGTNIPGTSTAIGTGNANTELISGSACGAGTAARLCADLVLGGYSDWYLPSKDEMTKLYLNRAAIGGFDNGAPYWSSSQDNSIPTTYAWFVAFYSSGNSFQESKNASYPNVRAVRSFSCPETPNSITGTATVTAGSTTTLSSTTTGGTWSSSATGIATVASTGVVTGVAAGTATISYTVTSTCGSAVATTVVTVNAALTIGATYGGGKIAYILQPGDPGYIAGETHGIIAAPSDQSTGIIWGCFGTNIPGTSTAIGTGNANTELISGSACGAGTAARLCADLVLGGYSDWYLPSKDEMTKLYLNRAAIGGFDDGETYWSSSQDNSIPTTYAWHVAFYSSGTSFQDSKNASYPNVRAVRAF